MVVPVNMKGHEVGHRETKVDMRGCEVKDMERYMVDIG